MKKLLLLTVIALTACGTQSQKPDDPPPVSAVNAAVLESLKQSLPGNYGNYGQFWEARNNTDDSQSKHWRLAINGLRSGSTEAWFSARQYEANDASQGRTQLLQFSSAGGSLTMRFAPWNSTDDPRQLSSAQLAATARFLPNCELKLATVGGVIAGQTDPSRCQLEGQNSALLALTKDFAISGSRIDVGERLVDVATGVPVRETSIFNFRRMERFSGWAGIRGADSNNWRLAQPLEAWSDGGTALLLDESGEPMGYSIRLGIVSWRTDQPRIMRLDLIESLTGEVVAYAFADTAVNSIGLNLGWIQVGLTKTN